MSGQIGDGLTFDGADDRLAVASEASFSATAFTLEAWANVPSPVPAGWGALVNHARQTGDEYGLWRSADIASHFHFRWTNAGTHQSINFTNAFTTNQWHYVAATLDSATTTATTYLDGAVDQRITNASTAAAGATGLGGLSTSGELWKGGLDEVRISMVARTSSWISAKHASMTGTLVTYGPASSSCPPN
ncbi:MAG: LamG domain-containing protein [Proteobacteria bacterium]|nr:LamG domain-containing protein [Pseudomonadota bacterium]